MTLQCQPCNHTSQVTLCPAPRFRVDHILKISQNLGCLAPVRIYAVSSASLIAIFGHLLYFRLPPTHAHLFTKTFKARIKQPQIVIPWNSSDQTCKLPIYTHNHQALTWGFCITMSKYSLSGATRISCFLERSLKNVTSFCPNEAKYQSQGPASDRKGGRVQHVRRHKRLTHVGALSKTRPIVLPHICNHK